MLHIQIEVRCLKDLIPYARKLRKHDHAVQRMVALLREYGFRIPVLILSTGEILDGHLRVKAAAVLKLNEIPVIVCDGWSEAKVKAFRLAVNRSSTWATWSMEEVALEFAELESLGFDLSLTGFDPPEIDALLFRPDSLAETVAELPAEAVSRPGDLWTCGPHRLLGGDSTNPEAVARLLQSQNPLLMVTDPPYGTKTDPIWRERAGLGEQRQTGSVTNDDRVDWCDAYKLFRGDVAYVWHAGVHASEVAANLESSGFDIRSQIIWAKQQFALSRGDYHWKHEPCWYAVRTGHRSNWCGDRKQCTVWDVANLNPFGGNREEVATGHGTQKPIELMRRPILNHTARGEVVYDPFLGSGTTLIAAELTHRVCYGLELEPRYVDVIVKRWQTMTGGAAVLDGSELTFEQVELERKAETEK